MDALRIRRFKDRAFAARRRVVAVAVVAALATISLIGSSAQAATPAATGTSTRCLTQEELFAAQCILVAKLFQAANTPDLSPKDMQVAAPSTVIAATSSSPRDVNRWRPNTQAWIDAKGRLAAGSGLSTKDIAATARWAPKLTKGIPIAGWLAMGAEVAYSVRDGMLMPSLGLRDDAAEESFCVREGNLATDLLGMLGGADCVDWRLKSDFRQLVAGAFDGMSVCFEGACLILSGVDLLTRYQDTLWYRYVRTGTLSPQYEFWTIQAPGTVSGGGGTRSKVWGTSYETWIGLPNKAGTEQRSASNGSTFDLIGWAPTLTVRNKTTKAEVARGEPQVDKDAEWITRVDCSDGSKRYSVSQAFQQEALGDVAVPEAVQLDGCSPVAVQVGSQPAGTGITPSNPWNPEPAPGAAPQPGTTTATPPAQVPQEVQDWMTNFPQCWDGSCRLTLKKVTESTTEVDCFTMPAECVDWYEESASNPTKYKCYYAGQSRALSDCFVYSRVFDKGKVQDGTGYGDPATGGDPGTGTGTKTNPGGALVAMREPVQNPSGDRQCWPTGWAAFNPFEWVFQPVRCALEWAFVPREAKLVQVQTAIKLAATNSRPGEMVQSISGWADAVNDIDPSGCAGPAVNLNLMGIVYSGHPLSACAEPAATLAWWSKLIIGVSVALAAALAITRYLGLQFGFSGVGRSPGGDS